MQNCSRFFEVDLITGIMREHSGLVVECLTRDRGVVGSSLTGITVLCPRAKHIDPCLVLV